MPSTHLSLHYHIVFSTKGRRRIIAEPWREELHAYIGGIVRGMGAVARSIGGTGDHVHVLAGLNATLTLADAVRADKARFVSLDSSEWCAKICVAGGLWRIYSESLAIEQSPTLHCEPGRTPSQANFRRRVSRSIAFKRRRIR
jgi:Transposase IS200 like